LCFSQFEDLMRKSQHIRNVLDNFISEQTGNNQLQLKALIDIVRVLTFQSVAFRGQNESVGSTSLKTFLEILDLVV
jgi:hypothetical protein